MANGIYGISSARDRAYACAAALTYWCFRCRDRAKSPAMGTKTWTFLESSIVNAAQAATTIEDYLQGLTTKLHTHLRPRELSWIVQPEQEVLRVRRAVDGSIAEIQQIDRDQDLAWMNWHDLLEDIRQDGFEEWDILELCRTRASIIQVLCRLRFEEDRVLGQDTPIETIEVEGINV